MRAIWKWVRDVIGTILSRPSYGACGGGDPAVWERHANEDRNTKAS
jgi:hypothetical protein